MIGSDLLEQVGDDTCSNAAMPALPANIHDEVVQGDLAQDDPNSNGSAAPHQSENTNLSTARAVVVNHAIEGMQFYEFRRVVENVDSEGMAVDDEGEETVTEKSSSDEVAESIEEK